MTPQEKFIYYHSHLEALKKCKQHLHNSMKLIDFEILSAEKEVELARIEPTKLTKRSPEDRIAFLEAANYKPEY